MSSHLVELCLLKVFDGYYMRAPAMKNQFVKHPKKYPVQQWWARTCSHKKKRARQGLTGSLLFCSAA
jgi:hypothetical protein